VTIRPVPVHGSSARLWPCLLHVDIHPDQGRACLRAFVKWLDGQHLRGQAACDAYAREVEQLILAELAREHAPHLFADAGRAPVAA
jgi:hypothetical protein